VNDHEKKVPEFRPEERCQYVSEMPPFDDPGESKPLYGGQGQSVVFSERERGGEGGREKEGKGRVIPGFGWSGQKSQ
jgi:hypothetical protein